MDVIELLEEARKELESSLHCEEEREVAINSAIYNIKAVMNILRITEE